MQKAVMEFHVAADNKDPGGYFYPDIGLSIKLPGFEG
jgi:hypothetical protein